MSEETFSKLWKLTKGLQQSGEYLLKKNSRREARRTTILQSVEQKPHSQKERQDEKAEGYVPDEGTR